MTTNLIKNTKKKTSEKKTAKIEKEIRDLKLFVLHRLGKSFCLINEYGNYLLVSKLVNINVHITVDQYTSFQPLAIDKLTPFTIITLIEICSDLGEYPALSKKDGNEIKNLRAHGVKIIKIYPDTNVVHKLESIGTNTVR